MEKKVLAYPAATNSKSNPHSCSSTAVPQQQSQTSNKFQSDRSNAKAKHNTYGDRDFSNGRGKFAQTNRGGSGYQRRSSQHQQNHEVMERSTDGSEQSLLTRRSGNEKSSRHGASASHLLNFTYAPLPSQEDRKFGRRSDYRREGRARRLPVHTKEQFLQAHCQFVVKESILEADYAQCLADPDKMVDWEHIEQVILNDEQMSSCPICLEIPTAAKITKCAHVYCWPCILHYLSLTDRKWAKCPICFDSIEEKDLKSVVTKALDKYKVGDEIQFQLMRKERGALYVRPKPMWKPAAAGHLFSLADEAEDLRFSKILSATVADIESIVSKERRQLSDLMEQEDTQSLEASFVEAALNALSERSKVCSFGKKPSLAKEQQANVGEEQLIESEPAFVRSIKSDPNLKSVSYADAFDDAAVEDTVNAASDSTLSDLAPDQSADGEMQQTVDLAAANGSAASGAETPKSPSRNRNASSTSSSDSGEAELLAADLVLPPTGTQPSRSSGSKRTETYYFYQSADGQLLYLHSINTRILAAQYGSMEMAPQTLTATILESEEHSLTQDVRRKLKYLSHLSLYSQYTVCEVSLRPPVVSSKTLAHFSEELNERKRARNRRIRTETKHNNRIQVEERRRMGKFPDMGVPLDSEREFPLGAAAAPPLLEQSPVAESVGSLSAAECSVPSRQHEVPLTTPYSFAQAMKGSSSTPSAVWPRVQTTTNYVRSNGPQQVNQVPGGAGEPEEEEDEVSAPSFRQSCRVDFDQVFSKLSVSVDEKKKTVEGDTQGQRSKKGKDKKKKKQLLLFSTAGQRSNQ